MVDRQRFNSHCTISKTSFMESKIGKHSLGKAFSYWKLCIVFLLVFLSVNTIHITVTVIIQLQSSCTMLNKLPSFEFWCLASQNTLITCSRTYNIVSLNVDIILQMLISIIQLVLLISTYMMRWIQVYYQRIQSTET